MEGSMQRFSHAVKVAGSAYPAGSRRRLRHANRRWNGSECGFGFLRVVGVIREGPSHDEQTPLIHGHLRVVILLKSGIRRVFHDARLRVGKIVLVAVTGSRHRRRRWAATRSAPGRALPLRALRQLGFILRLSGGQPLGGARLQASAWILVPSKLIVPNFSTPASCASKSTCTNRSFSSSRNVRRNVASVSWSGCWLPAMKRKGTAS